MVKPGSSGERVDDPSLHRRWLAKLDLSGIVAGDIGPRQRWLGFGLSSERIDDSSPHRFIGLGDIALGGAMTAAVAMLIFGVSGTSPEVRQSQKIMNRIRFAYMGGVAGKGGKGSAEITGQYCLEDTPYDPWSPIVKGRNLPKISLENTPKGTIAVITPSKNFHQPGTRVRLPTLELKNLYGPSYPQPLNEQSDTILTRDYPCNPSKPNHWPPNLAFNH